ncbi:MAG: hypothetical protein ACOCQU_00515 [Halolamina sp.]
MAPDDTDADSSVDAGDVTDTRTTGDADAAPTDAGRAVGGPSRDLAARLSTAPPRRAYGVERVSSPEVDNGLFTPRERQYLQHAHRLDDPDRNAVEAVLSERVTEFVDADWPVIREQYPDVAATIRDELCGSDD